MAHGCFEQPRSAGCGSRRTQRGHAFIAGFQRPGAQTSAVLRIPHKVSVVVTCRKQFREAGKEPSRVPVDRSPQAPVQQSPVAGRRRLATSLAWGHRRGLPGRAAPLPGTCAPGSGSPRGGSQSTGAGGSGSAGAGVAEQRRALKARGEFRGRAGLGAAESCGAAPRERGRGRAVAMGMVARGTARPGRDAMGIAGVVRRCREAWCRCPGAPRLRFGCAGMPRCRAGAAPAPLTRSRAVAGDLCRLPVRSARLGRGGRRGQRLPGCPCRGTNRLGRGDTEVCLVRRASVAVQFHSGRLKSPFCRISLDLECLKLLQFYIAC